VLCDVALDHEDDPSQDTSYFMNNLTADHVVRSNMMPNTTVPARSLHICL
jgi:hypothetical protein